MQQQHKINAIMTASVFLASSTTNKNLLLASATPGPGANNNDGYLTGVAGQESEMLGVVMDRFCVDRGTALDNSGLIIEDRPYDHTVHCLVDPGICVNSGYCLMLRQPDDKWYCRYNFTADETQKLVAWYKAERSAGGSPTTTGAVRIPGTWTTAEAFVIDDTNIARADWHNATQPIDEPEEPSSNNTTDNSSELSNNTDNSTNGTDENTNGTDNSTNGTDENTNGSINGTDSNNGSQNESEETPSAPTNPVVNPVDPHPPTYTAPTETSAPPTGGSGTPTTTGGVTPTTIATKPHPNTDSDSSADDDGLSGGIIALIVIGVLLVLAGVAAAVMVMKRRSSAGTGQSSDDKAPIFHDVPGADNNGPAMPLPEMAAQPDQRVAGL